MISKAKHSKILRERERIFVIFKKEMQINNLNTQLIIKDERLKKILKLAFILKI